MDIQRFRDSREKELSDFKKQYDSLKTEYSSVLMSAIREQDPARQQELIQQVLSINSSMADEIRQITEKLNKGSRGVNPKELDDLTRDLIQYQKDYSEIEKSRDKVNTLKLILENDHKKLNVATTLYNVYVSVLVGLLVVVAWLVFKTEWARHLAKSIVPTSLLR